MDLLVKGARVISPGDNFDKELDILIKKGVIEKIAKGIKAPKAKVINAKGKVAVPGLIDMHTHLREPGREDKESLYTGSLAAAAGGFTAIACMANTNPVNDNAAVTRFILEQARLAPAKVLPIAAISQGMQGEVLVEMGDLVEAGAVAFSDDGKTVPNSKLLRHALEYASLFEKPLFCHCQDNALFADGIIHEGVISAGHGLVGIPPLAEEIDIARTIMLAEYLKV
ncbi:MAG: amidohydrolase family protein, partial [Candidatus Omnitrophica bacterium]|nr:amidohydrolase family protein [Candidatus Omnitrophota bacterium]